DRNAVKRTERVALHSALVEHPRLREHMLAIEMRERLDLAVERLDARETGARIGLGGNRAGGDFGGSLACGQCHKPIVGHAQLLRSRLVCRDRARHAARAGGRYSRGSWYICAVTGMPWVRAAAVARFVQLGKILRVPATPAPRARSGPGPDPWRLKFGWSNGE